MRASLLLLVFAARALAEPNTEMPLIDLYGGDLPAGCLARMGSIAFRTNAETKNLKISPDGKIIATAGTRGVTLLDAATGNVIRYIVPPNCLDSDGLALDNKTLAFLAGDQPKAFGALYPDRIHLCDAKTGKELRVIRTKEAQHSITLSPDGKELASIGEDGVRFWNVATGTQTHVAAVDPKVYVRTLAYSPDGKWAVFAGYGGENNLLLWDTSKHKVIARAKDDVQYDNLAISPDSRRVVTYCHSGRVWDIPTLKLLREGQAPDYLGHLRFSTDGKLLLGTNSSGAMILLDSESRAVRREIPGVFRGVDITPDGKTLVGIKHYNRYHDRIRFWDVATGEEVQRFAGHDLAINALAFSSEGKYLASAGVDGTVRLWDAHTGKQHWVRQGQG